MWCAGVGMPDKGARGDENVHGNIRGRAAVCGLRAETRYSLGTGHALVAQHAVNLLCPDGYVRTRCALTSLSTHTPVPRNEAVLAYLIRIWHRSGVQEAYRKKEKGEEDA